jgi:GntR family transcriptional regulator, transcriptional repressor for pyruvate dehydrogenase complex
MKFSNATQHRAHGVVLEQIFDQILRGSLRKGDRLPSEREIAAQMGVSRTSVRAALEILKEAGVVEITTGRRGGARLASESIASILMGIPREMNRRQMTAFYEARNILETSAAALAALRATPAQIEEMERTMKEMEKLVAETPGDNEAYYSIDIHFHRLVVQSAGNEALFDAYIPILRQLLQVISWVNAVDMHAYGLASMQQFVQAVRRRDAQAARAAIEAHVQPLEQFVSRKSSEVQRSHGQA